MKKLFLFCLLACHIAAGDLVCEKVFTEIYDKGVWGKNKQGVGHSGGGSDYKNALAYIKFLEEFMALKEVRSVVDFGCGDWTFSQHVNWSGIEYLGIDVVKKVIENNTEKYSSSNVTFISADGVNYELPEADLIVCKDVLQHLPNDDIKLFLKQLYKFKHCLITNDIDPHPQNNNAQISVGNWRPIDLTIAPFNLKAEKIFIYKGDIGGRYKQVFYIKNE